MTGLDPVPGRLHRVPALARAWGRLPPGSRRCPRSLRRRESRSRAQMTVIMGSVESRGEWERALLTDGPSSGPGRAGRGHAPWSRRCPRSANRCLDRGRARTAAFLGSLRSRGEGEQSYLIPNPGNGPGGERRGRGAAGEGGGAGDKCPGDKCPGDKCPGRPVRLGLEAIQPQV